MSKKLYTNKEKLEYFRERVKKDLAKIARLETLPPDEVSFQDWGSDLREQLNELRQLILKKEI